MAVSKIGQLLARSQAAQVLSSIVPDSLVQADYAQWQGQVRTALSNYDDLELARIYGQVFSTYSLNVVFQDIFMPVWMQALQQRRSSGKPVNGSCSTPSCAHGCNSD